MEEIILELFWWCKHSEEQLCEFWIRHPHFPACFPTDTKEKWHSITASKRMKHHRCCCFLWAHCAGIVLNRQMSKVRPSTNAIHSFPRCREWCSAVASTSTSVSEVLILMSVWFILAKSEQCKIIAVSASSCEQGDSLVIWSSLKFNVTQPNNVCSQCYNDHFTIFLDEF